MAPAASLRSRSVPTSTRTRSWSSRIPPGSRSWTWRDRAAADHQVVLDHIARYGETSAQRLFNREFVATVQRLSGLGHLEPMAGRERAVLPPWGRPRQPGLE